jgi:hypothetical protein
VTLPVPSAETVVKIATAAENRGKKCVKTNTEKQSSKSAAPATTRCGITRAPDTMRAGCMKVAARQDSKALDYFTSTIIPCGTLRAAAVLTIKHALLLVGFAVALMALMRQLLAD